MKYFKIFISIKSSIMIHKYGDSSDFSIVFEFIIINSAILSTLTPKFETLSENVT